MFFVQKLSMAETLYMFRNVLLLPQKVWLIVMLLPGNKLANQFANIESAAALKHLRVAVGLKYRLISYFGLYFLFKCHFKGENFSKTIF
jgi:hypothetical protein